MEFTFGQRISGLAIDGRELQAAVFNENEVRAAAGLTMVLGATAFAYALFAQQYVPIRVVTTFFFVEFLVRSSLGIRYSPLGVIARWMTQRQPPEWVSAKPKRFAWRIGVGMSFAMMVITNLGITGALPMAICLICLTMMWMEAVLGVCLGCEIHALMVRRGLTANDPGFEVCAHGACELPGRTPVPASTEVAAASGAP